MTSVKLLSGWSNPGGSTHHHIALTNLLNSKGVECVFYGPHDYHLDKCKSDTLDKLQLGPEHILISHFLHTICEPVSKRLARGRPLLCNYSSYGREGEVEESRE